MRRMGAMVPEPHAKALEQAAQDNGRTIAAEIRMAIQEWLKAHGRIAA